MEYPKNTVETIIEQPSNSYQKRLVCYENNIVINFDNPNYGYISIKFTCENTSKKVCEEVVSDAIGKSNNGPAKEPVGMYFNKKQNLIEVKGHCSNGDCYNLTFKLNEEKSEKFE